MQSQTVRNQTTQELDHARKHYREERLPKEALAIMDSETARLAANKIEERALAAGDIAPDFTLPDAQGRSVSLRALLQEGPVVVIFYRGGWCPYCNIQLRGFQRALPAMTTLGARIVAISPQLPDNSLSTQEKDEIEYPVLSDVGNKVAREFGLVYRLGDPLLKLLDSFGNSLVKANGEDGATELPLPGTFVIDSKGVIRRARVDVDYTRRLDPDEVVETIKQIV